MKFGPLSFIAIPATVAAVLASIGVAPAALASPGGALVPAGAATPHVAATIPVGTEPVAIAADPRTGKVYVGNLDNGILNRATVSVIDGTTSKVIATIRGFTNPRAVAADPRTGRVYVTGYGSGNKIAVISERTDKVIATITGQFAGLAVNPGTDKIYTGDAQGVAVISGATNTVVAQVRYPPRGFTGGAVDPRYNRIFFGEGDQETVAMINGNTNKLITHLPENFPVTDVAVNPRTNLLYVTDFDSPVPVLSAQTGQSTGTILPSAGSSNSGIAVNPRTGLVYIASEDNVVTVDNAATGTMVTSIPVPGTPEAVTTNPATGKAYVADQNSNTVSVIAP
jgi:YVTN family beta-propeller protein